MSYTEHPHIREWMASHESYVLESRYSESFHRYLESLPWLPSKIDWSELRSVFVSLEDGEVDLQSMAETPIGRHQYTMVCYKAADAAILCRTDDDFRDADLLCMRASGPRYMCGAQLIDHTPVLTVEAFAEYDLPGLTVSL